MGGAPNQPHPAASAAVGGLQTTLLPKCSCLNATQRSTKREQCLFHGRGIFDPRHHTTGFLESFIWATEYLRQQKRNGRKGELQAGRVDRKWFSRVVEVQKLLKDGDSTAAARAWREYCGGASLEPGIYDTKFLTTFLKQYTDELKRPQGT